MNEIRCRICGIEVLDYLPDHLLEIHNKTVEGYLGDYPEAPTVSDRLMERFRKETNVKKRINPPDPSKLTTKLGKIVFPVNSDVPEEACLPLPPHYRVPTHGRLGEDIDHALCMLRNRRAMYIHGMPGCGKDALFHAYSWYTRTPAIIRQVQPGTDIESWFFTRSFNQAGTFWEEGEVLKALRDGFTTTTGRIIPYLLLVTDFDRADREQAEHLRLINDTIQGRVQGPGGRVFPVLPGTQVVGTGNTAGGGDPRARMMANPIDASLMDRWKVLEFHWMDWGDEEGIVVSKFPLLFQKFPALKKKLGRVTSNIRTEIVNGKIMAEFSHRAICHILEHAQDVLSLQIENGDAISDKLMAYASRVWLDGLPDEDNREKARNIMGADFKTLNEGNVGHIGKGNLSNNIGK